MPGRQRTLSISKKGILVVSVPLMAQLAFGIALLVISRRAVEAHAQELHSQQVLDGAYGLKASLLAAQASQRGYVLSRSLHFRQAREEAERHVPQEIADLTRLVADNPGQTARVRRMAAAATELVRFQDDNFSMVEQGKQIAAASRIGEGVGDRLMDRFLEPMNAFLTEESRLAGERHTQASASNRQTIFVVASGMALNTALAGTLAAGFAIGIRRRLSVLTDNARRLAGEQPLLPPLDPGDEIAEVDRVFREMAVSLTRTTEALRQANQEMESFSYSVSHDLRTPLRAIEGFSRIVQEEYAPQLDAEGNRLLGVIRRNTVNMAQLIDDLLTFSRLSRQPVTLTEIDIGALARETFGKVRPPESERAIECVVDAGMPSVHADLSLLRQTMINLLANAVKFTQPRPAARIEVGSTTVNGERAFFVKDNGVGFDVRYVDKLFGVFQRLHHASEFEGTGVGLAIVQRVIHRHGGRVWAESVLGEGATFWFTVPEELGETDAGS
jgi:signal transduction histidine kinase